MSRSRGEAGRSYGSAGAGRDGRLSAFSRSAVTAARIATAAAHVLACAAFACIAFFSLLTAWGLIVAPYARLSSSSFVIVCALVLSGVATVLAYGAFSRWLATRRRRDSLRRDSC